jgi:TM2 domain-containing membrane protein YozV
MKYFLIFILLLRVCNPIVFAQNANDYFADSLKTEQNLYLLSLEKQIFVQTNTEKKNEILLLKAQYCKQNEMFKKALQALKRINIEDDNDTIERLVYYESALNSFALNRYTDCIFFSTRILNFSSFKDTIEMMSYLLLTLSYNEILEYERAYQYSKLFVNAEFENCIFKDSIICIIDSMYLANPTIKALSADKSGLLSTIVPGLGHVYAGKVGEGIGQFSLNIAFLGLAIYTLSTSHYVTAILFQAPFLLKFYSGGIRRSRYLTEKKNYERQKEFNLSVKSMLLNGCHANQN